MAIPRHMQFAPARWLGAAAHPQARGRSSFFITSASDGGTSSLSHQAYFDSKSITAPEVRRGLNSVFANDLVPDVTILTSALQASRRTNDFATCAAPPLFR